MIMKYFYYGEGPEQWHEGMSVKCGVTVKIPVISKNANKIN